MITIIAIMNTIALQELQSLIINDEYTFTVCYHGNNKKPKLSLALALPLPLPLRAEFYFVSSGLTNHIAQGRL